LSDYQLLKEVVVRSLFHDELVAEFHTIIKSDNLDKIKKYNLEDMEEEVNLDTDSSPDNDNVTATDVLKEYFPGHYYKTHCTLKIKGISKGVLQDCNCNHLKIWEMLWSLTKIQN